MASEKNSKDFQRQYKPSSPDISVYDFTMYTICKEMELDLGSFNRRRLPKEIKFNVFKEIEQDILQFKYRPKVPASPAKIIKRCEFARALLKFQDK